MKIVKIVGVIFLLIIIVSVSLLVISGLRDHAREKDFMARPTDGESYAKKLARYRASADASARAECTNAVVGLRQIMSLRTDTSADNFMQWTASATVEFINQVGGVERTDLRFQFNPSLNGEPSWRQSNP